ncbi:hypothetical protein FRB99_003560 [Tulasnella sp. 403]|nr:hypothetical protein FRB99_003560 [Tulasnella sp. 403]
MTTLLILSGHLPLYQYRNLATLNRGVIERQEKPPKEPERSPLNFSYMPLWEIAEACWSDDPGVRPTLASILPRLESEATMAARKGTSLPQIHRVPMRVPSITRSSPPSPNRQPPAPKRNAITFAPGITDYTNRLRHRTFTVGSPLLSELARVYEGELGGNQPVSFAVVRRPSGDNLRAASSEDKQAMEKLIKRAWYDWEKVASGHGIIPYMGYAFLDESVCLITDSTQERPILQFLNAGRTADRLHLLRQAAEALCFLHSRQPEIVHGDVSDVNVMVNTHGEAMLRNFGLWTLLGNKEGQGDDANPDASQYTAPEVLADGTFTTQGDVFSFGRLALEVLTLEPGAPKVPDALWNTLNSCWEYVPDERPELDDILKEESVSSSSSVSSY